MALTLPAVKTSRRFRPPFSDWLLAVAIALGVLVLGAAAWLYTQYTDTGAAPRRPQPVWLSVSKVTAQMADGRMVNIKVNLSLDRDEARDELSEHIPAFKGLIQEVGTRTSREDLQSPEGMKQFAAAIRTSLNAYLEHAGVEGQVKDVAFEEFTLLP